MQHHIRLLFSLSILALFLFSSILFAGPETVNLKINISDDSGPFEGIKRVDVSLFDNTIDSGWREIHNEIYFSSGSADIELGDVNTALPSTLIRLSQPIFNLKIDGIESIVTFAPSATPYAIDMPTLWDGTLLGSKPPDSFDDGVIHPDWIIGGIDGGGGGGGGVANEDDVRDVVKDMVEGNTENGITVDTSGDPLVLNFDVSDPIITLTGHVTGAATMTNLGNVSLATILAEVIPITQGGTGATNQNDALTNLGLTGLSPYSESGSDGIKVDGDFWVTGAFYFEGAFTPGAPSDIRFKKNIQTIPDVVNKLSVLRGVYYDWKVTDFPKKNFPDTRQIGVIAQEIETVFPELITHDLQGYKRVNYMVLSAILIEGFNQQQQQIESLEARLTAIEEAQ